MMFLDAKPNAAHKKLAELEQAGKLKAIITQNIDGLHQAAGSKNVYEIHGSIHRNYCQKCGKFYDAAYVKNSKGVPVSYTHLIPYITNVTAEAVTDVRKSPGLLVTQLTSSVRWQQSMEKMIADGVDTFIEIGPGKTLAGFMKKIDRSVKVCNVATWEDLEKRCV